MHGSLPQFHIFSVEHVQYACTDWWNTTEGILDLIAYMVTGSFCFCMQFHQHADCRTSPKLNFQKVSSPRLQDREQIKKAEHKRNGIGGGGGGGDPLSLDSRPLVSFGKTLNFLIFSKISSLLYNIILHETLIVFDPIQPTLTSFISFSNRNLLLHVCCVDFTYCLLDVLWSFPKDRQSLFMRGH